MKKADAKIAELDEREQRWKQFEIQIEENSKKLTNTIILNVGGKRFITSKSTLLMHNDTYFTALLSSGQFMVLLSLYYKIDYIFTYFLFYSQRKMEPTSLIEILNISLSFWNISGVAILIFLISMRNSSMLCRVS